jgi:phage head maturation protease
MHKEVRAGQTGQCSHRQVGGQPVRTFSVIHLMEISVVDKPANPRCVIISVEKK